MSSAALPHNEQDPMLPWLLHVCVPIGRQGCCCVGFTAAECINLPTVLSIIHRYHGQLDAVGYSMGDAWLPPCTTKLRLLNVGCEQGWAGV